MGEAIEQWVAKLNRRITREKIVEPHPEFGEYVDQCPWSKTGWGVHRKDGSCTCMPTRIPGKKKPQSRKQAPLFNDKAT